jgi:hypothetical protein
LRVASRVEALRVASRVEALRVASRVEALRGLEALRSCYAMLCALMLLQAHRHVVAFVLAQATAVLPCLDSWQMLCGLALLQS